MTLAKVTAPARPEPRMDRLLRVQAELGVEVGRGTDVEVRTLREALVRARADADRLRADADGLRASTSWRVTAPLRSISDRWHRRAAAR